ncbi:MAG TPA: BadF/BadG/BcrA/BcrD ATPase family protein [Clostridia bacterium]|nr:BadF/BadG/BcrA/BcrD ATPase family protein [Clostridia bacterium]
MVGIGIDGGGTHTRLLALDETGKTLWEGREGSTNLESNPPERVRARLAALLDGLFAVLPPESCRGLCMGAAGVDTPRTQAVMEGLLASLDLPFPCRVVNDSEIALYAQTEGGPGILVIAGTGSVCLGRDGAGRTRRSGGFGYLFGDEGSGYWLASQAIALALRAFDGRHPATALEPALCRALGIKRMDEVMDLFYGENKSEVAALAPVVLATWQEGDAAAAALVEGSAGHLADMAHAVWTKLGAPQADWPLVEAGGLLLHAQAYRALFERKIRQALPSLRPVPLTRSAVMGAALWALSEGAR